MKDNTVVRIIAIISSIVFSSSFIFPAEKKGNISGNFILIIMIISSIALFISTFFIEYNIPDKKIKKNKDKKKQKKNVKLEPLLTEEDLNRIEMLNSIPKPFIELKSVKNKENDKEQYDYMKYTKVRKLENNYTVLDFETTGLTPGINEIIEIGAIKYRNDKPIDTFQTYVKPIINDIDPYITKLTGISEETVANSPSLKDVLPELINFIDGENIVAHNASFDMKFLLIEMNNNNIPYQKFRVIDTLPLARKNLPFLKNHKLATLKEYLDINIKSHNALDDCKVTGELYKHIKIKIAEK